MATKKYDSTVARIAGNILSGYEFAHKTDEDDARSVHQAVEMARAIVMETERTELSGDASARLRDAAPDLLASVREFVMLYDGLRDSIGISVKEKLLRAEAALVKAECRSEDVCR